MALETEGDGFYSLLEAPMPAPSMAMESDTDESSPKLPPATPFSYSAEHLGKRKNWSALELQSTPYQFLHLGLNLCNSVSILELHHLHLGLNLNISVSVSISATQSQYQNSITFISVSISISRSRFQSLQLGFISVSLNISLFLISGNGNISVSVSIFLCNSVSSWSPSPKCFFFLNTYIF
ncbi:hypothetical protein ACB092_06G071200 [Castanea dentata]